MHTVMRVLGPIMYAFPCWCWLIFEIVLAGLRIQSLCLQQKLEPSIKAELKCNVFSLQRYVGELNLQPQISVSVTAGMDVRSYLEERAEWALKMLCHLQRKKKKHEGKVYKFIDLRFMKEHRTNWSQPKGFLLSRCSATAPGSTAPTKVCRREWERKQNKSDSKIACVTGWNESKAF